MVFKKVILILLFLILTFLPVMAETAKELIKKGKELVEQKEVLKTEEALKYFRKAIEIEPDNFEAWFYSVMCLNDAQTIKEMKDCLNKAIESNLNINKNNVNVRLTGDWTPLILAVYCHNIKACKLLIEKGASVNMADDDGLTPLDMAACHGQKEIAELLLRNGADINIKHKRTGDTPLGSAVFYRQYDMVSFLISQKADTSDYPLFYAVCTDNTREIKTLLNRGIVNSRAFNNQTPLHFARTKEVAKLLISGGALVDAIDDEKMTPLHRASFSGFKEVVKVLVEKGASVNAKDVYGATPLHCAVYCGNKYIVEFLIENGASVNEKDDMDKTPLDEAEKDEIKEILIRYGAKSGSAH